MICGISEWDICVFSVKTEKALYTNDVASTHVDGTQRRCVAVKKKCTKCSQCCLLYGAVLVAKAFVNP